MLDVYYYDSINELFEKYKNNKFYFASKKAPNSYHEVNYNKDDFLVFGKETAGLPENLLKKHINCTIRIPMVDEARSLNLANSAAVILYEALRQNKFSGFKLYNNI